MPYLICDNENDSQAVLSQVRAEGFNGWVTVHMHPMTGQVAVLLPGYQDYAKFNKDTLDTVEAVQEEGFF